MTGTGWIARATLAVVVACSMTPFVTAQERHDERFEREQARPGPAVRFDDRYAHDHYYPQRGVYVQALPRGSTSLAFRGDRYFFRAGVWYHPEGGRFVVIAPPIGIVVPLLPPAYVTVYANGAPYYYANGTYYSALPGQGYAVVVPPPGAEVGDGAPQAAGGPQPSDGPQSPYGPQAAYGPQSQQPQQAPQAAAPPDPIVYPRNGQPPQQVSRDRGECAQWATGQSTGSADPDVFRRAFEACMDGRGYTVR